MRTKMIRITTEQARAKLAERRTRLAKLIELDAPEAIIAENQRMVRDAIYAVETGELRVTL